eukprot:scaffold23186_cov52-Cyclotella_meneghiniana.AAC.5
MLVNRHHHEKEWYSNPKLPTKLNSTNLDPRHLWGLDWPLSRFFLGGPLAFGELCGGRDRDCSPPTVNPPGTSTMPIYGKKARYPSCPMFISGQQPSYKPVQLHT